MRIAVCDDDEGELRRLSTLVGEYALGRERDVACDAFAGAAELIAQVGRRRYDAVLLDIMMPGLDGVEAAREIRAQDADIAIVFLTSSREYGPESYEVGALFYALKPVKEETLYALLDKALYLRERRPEASLLVASRGGGTRIAYMRIEYVEVVDKSVYFHLVDGSVYEARGTLAAFEEQLLADACFVKPHRSYIVNLRHVSLMENGGLRTGSGVGVPVSRNLYAEVKRAYLDYLFQQAASMNGKKP